MQLWSAGKQIWHIDLDVSKHYALKLAPYDHMFSHADMLVLVMFEVTLKHRISMSLVPHSYI